MSQRTLASLAVLPLTLALTACGGSSDESTPPLQNQTPQIAPIVGLTIKEGLPLTINASATDSDGSIASYKWQQTAGITVQMVDTESASLNLTIPMVDEDQTVTFKLTVTDNDGASTSISVDVLLRNNIAPTATIAPLTQIDEGQTYTLTATVADEDGDIATTQWQQVSGSTAQLSGEMSDTLTVTMPKVTQTEAGQLKFVATDDSGESTELLLDFTINNTHHNIELSGNANNNGANVGDTDITLTLNEQNFVTTTDADGNYVLPVDIDILQQQGSYKLSADMAQNPLVRTGQIAELLQNINVQQQAVNKAVIARVTASQQTTAINGDVQADLNSLTTADYLYLVTLFGDKDFINDPSTDATVLATQYKSVDTELLLEIATALSYAEEQNQLVPTSNGMVGLQEYLSEIYADDAGKVLFDSLLSQQKQQTGNKASEFLANGKTYYATLASAPGTVRLGLPFNLSYTFAENGIFTQQSLDEITTASWSVDGSGIVVDASSWSTQVQSNWIEGVAEPATCTYTPINKRFEMIKGRFKGVQQAVETFKRHRVCVDRDNGAEVANEIIDEEMYFTAFNIDDVEVWQEKDLQGQSIVFEHYSETALELNRLQNSLPAMTYQFNDNGSGSVLEDNANFTWLIDADGVLIMSFSDYSIRWLKLFDDRSDRKGGASVFALYEKDEINVQYSNMATTLSASSWQASDLVGNWDHGFSSSQPKYDVMGYGIKWELLADGSANLKATSADGSILYKTTPLQWYMENNQVVLYRSLEWVNGNPTSSNCDPRSDSNCFYRQYRSWQLLGQHGNRYYVLESLYDNGNPWQDGPLALEEIAVHHRTNFYQPFKKGQ
ncbi:PKD domain-containing protein [Shewanella sp. 10N.286.54.B9]|uniref:PKD domain-containing protein n=1 Tax=Shewanella sp. 10N.286.54.B9 TaxID=3229719 RepID=UPI00354C437F